jgi:hypothetical protein
MISDLENSARKKTVQATKYYSVEPGLIKILAILGLSTSWTAQKKASMMMVRKRNNHFQ